MKIWVFNCYYVAGDSQNQVHMEGYQVSNQCQALVRDQCLVPTKDAPELAYVRQSTAEKYIPDVYYKVSPCLQKTIHHLVEHILNLAGLCGSKNSFND